MNESFNAFGENPEDQELSKKERIQREIDALNEQISSDIEEEGEVIFENSAEDIFDAPIKEIFASIKRKTLEDQFISTEYNNPLNRELIDNIISKKIQQLEDLSTNSWRVKLQELLDNNSDEEMALFKSKIADTVSDEIIKEINSKLEEGFSSNRRVI